MGQSAADLPSSLLQAASLPATSPYLSLFTLSGFSGAAAGARGSQAHCQDEGPVRERKLTLRLAATISWRAPHHREPPPATSAHGGIPRVPAGSTPPCRARQPAAAFLACPARCAAPSPHLPPTCVRRRYTPPPLPRRRGGHEGGQEEPGARQPRAGCRLSVPASALLAVIILPSWSPTQDAPNISGRPTQQVTETRKQKKKTERDEWYTMGSAHRSRKSLYTCSAYKYTQPQARTNSYSSSPNYSNPPPLIRFQHSFMGYGYIKYTTGYWWMGSCQKEGSGACCTRSQCKVTGNHAWPTPTLSPPPPSPPHTHTMQSEEPMRSSAPLLLLLPSTTR